MGYSHVVFENVDDFKKALEMTGVILGGRWIDISVSRGKQVKQINTDVPDDCRTVFVKGLPYSFTED